jgi:hypothetical protein
VEIIFCEAKNIATKSPAPPNGATSKVKQKSQPKHFLTPYFSHFLSPDVYNPNPKYILFCKTLDCSRNYLPILKPKD